MIEYANSDEFRRKLKTISENAKFKVSFINGLKTGIVYINGIKHPFGSEKISRNGYYRLEDECYGKLIRAFSDELARAKREMEDFKICKNMLSPEDYTKIRYKGSKFIVETDNSIYKKAKSASELIDMIGRVKGGSFV